MITKEKRYFTPHEAGRALPLVAQIVADILEKGQALRAIEAEGRHEDAALHARERQLRAEITAHIQELESVGCEYKDFTFTKGLVDFPAKLGGEEVLLCWQPGEERVEFYHGVDEGAAGRRRLPAEVLVATAPPEPPHDAAESEPAGEEAPPEPPAE